MKKQYIPIFLFIFFRCFNIQAQEAEDKNRAVKLYSNFHILNSEEASNFQLPDSSGFHFHNISVAFSKNKKNTKRFIEGELSFLYRNKDGDRLLTETFFDTLMTPPRLITSEKNVPINSEDIVFRLRFELGRWVKNFEDKKLKLGWSPSLGAYVHSSKVTPKTSESFPITSFQAFFKIALVPRVQYSLTPNLFLDLNFPIQIMSFGFDSTTIENPVLTERQQKQGGFDFDLTGEVLMRFGVGYRF